MVDIVCVKEDCILHRKVLSMAFSGTLGMLTGAATARMRKDGLCRLKQQLMSEQEGEEEKVGWRVEAEVKLALQEALANQAQQGITNEGLLLTLRHLYQKTSNAHQAIVMQNAFSKKQTNGYICAQYTLLANR